MILNMMQRATKQQQFPFSTFVPEDVRPSEFPYY
jgi:hypothetical protein